jgi:hypothetical protein
MHDIILEKETEFPHIQPYNEKFGSNARLLVWTEARQRMRARYNRDQSACARLCGGKPARLCS